MNDEYHIFILEVREKYIHELHKNLIDPVDDTWHIYVVSDDEGGIYETIADNIDLDRWDTRVSSYNMNEIYFEKADKK